MAGEGRVAEQRAFGRDVGLDPLYMMMRSIQSEVLNRLDQFSEVLKNHMDEESQERKDLREELNGIHTALTDLNRIHEAFPHDKDGQRDYRGHRIHHETLIEKAERERKEKELAEQQAAEDKKTARKAAIENAVKVAFYIGQTLLMVWVATHLGIHA